MTTERSTVGRRRVLQSLGSLAVVGAIAGCSTDGGGGGGDGGGDGGSDGGSDGGDGGNSEVEDYLSGVSNYSSVQDQTGKSEVTVDVGVQANGGAFGFGPAAIRVDSGTGVVWEWTGNGSSHNVVHEDGEFESDQTMEEGFTFSHTFDSGGTYLYYCNPHKTLGMKGAVVVE